MLLFILLLIGAYGSQCNTSIYVDFLAITGNGGKLVPSKIIFNGEGKDLFLNIQYTTDRDTQISFIDAYRLASTGCNVFADVGADVSGGSGGLLLYIVLKYRTNLTGATGGIDAQGNILPISGLYEKLRAGSTRYDNFVVPIGSIYQYYVSRILSYNITYVQHISNLTYKDGRVYGSVEPPSSIFSLPKIPIKRSRYNTSLLEPVYLELREFYNSIGPINVDEEAKAKIEKYYKDYLEVVDKIAEKGYYYTASNYLFIASSHRNALYSISNNLNPEDLKAKAMECLRNLNIRGNSENDIAALTRYEWANEALKNTYGQLHEQKYSRYYDYTQAYLWCKLAQHIYENKILNYSNNTKLIMDWLSIALEQNMNFDELDSSRYKIALSKIITDPLIALYNLAFIVRKDSDLKSSYKSIWANIYASQAEYLSQTEGFSSEVTRLASLSNNLEELFSDNPSIMVVTSKNDIKWVLIGIAIVIVLLILIRVLDLMLRALLIILLLLLILLWVL